MNYETELRGEFTRITNEKENHIHWITRSSLEGLCEVSSLMDFELLVTDIIQFLNSTKVDVSLDGDVPELSSLEYEKPQLSDLEKKYFLDNADSYLKIFEDESYKHVKLAIEGRYKKAIKKSKNDYELADVCTICYLKGDFSNPDIEEVVIKDDYLRGNVKLIEVTELHRHGKKKNPNEIDDLLSENINIVELVLSLHGRKPGEGYPYFD